MALSSNIVMLDYMTPFNTFNSSRLIRNQAPLKWTGWSECKPLTLTFFKKRSLNGLMTHKIYNGLKREHKGRR